MENYEEKLLSIESTDGEQINAVFSFSELMKFSSIRDVNDFEKLIKSLARKLPFKTNSWPRFGNYVEDWYKVEVTQINYNIYYCERGGCDIRNQSDNFFDAAYEIFKIVAPEYTEIANTFAIDLDRIADQRLLIWLRSSSEVYHMLQTNEIYGLRSAADNVTWMCEELVRMGITDSLEDAFNKKTHIIKGLSLSGLSLQQANEIYNRLGNS
jgi:hypothetical protein